MMSQKDGMPSEQASTTGSGVRAFTVLELMVVVAMLVLLVTVLLPELAPRRRDIARGHCFNNLKQIGIACRIWADDNNGLYPMEVYTNASGGPLFLGSNVFRYFQVMSNELNTPKILVCPADWERPTATNFANDVGNNHVSYFLGLSCDQSRPQMLLSGDRNITNGTSLQNSVLTLGPDHQAHWTKMIHNRNGNVGFTDGSVREVDDKQLNAVVAASGTNINRLGMP